MGKSRRGGLRGFERSAGQKAFATRRARSESTVSACDDDRGKPRHANFTYTHPTLANVLKSAFSSYCIY